MGALQVELYDRFNNSLGDISTECLDKKYTRRLSRPSTGRIGFQSHLVPEISIGDTCLKIRENGVLKHNGIVWFLEDDGDEDTRYSQALSVDPLIWTRYRYARDDDGDYSNPQFFQDTKFGPAIVRQIIRNALTWDASQQIDPENPEGPGIPLYLGPLDTGEYCSMGIDPESGTFETGGPDLSGAPADWPILIGDIISLLCDTGVLDVVLNPVDDNDGYAPDIMGVINAYNGNYGQNLSGAVNFDYLTGDLSARAMSRTLDMETISNAIRYLLGPKQSIQQWAYGLDTTSKRIMDLSNDGDPAPFAALQALIYDSRAKYGKFTSIRNYDSFENADAAVMLFCNLFQTEALLRVKPRELITVTPRRGILPAFGEGDIIGVSAGEELRGGFESAQMRVYEYTVSEDKDGVPAIDQIVTSADQESTV